jgi:hypothetical protein
MHGTALGQLVSDEKAALPGFLPNRQRTRTRLAADHRPTLGASARPMFELQRDFNRCYGGQDLGVIASCPHVLKTGARFRSGITGPRVIREYDRQIVRLIT